MLPDERGGAAQRLHADLLTAVQLSHGAHHHMNRVEHQGRRQLKKKHKEKKNEEPLKMLRQFTGYRSIISS